MTKLPADAKVELVARLTDFHKRLSLDFEGRTGEQPPKRPRYFEPQFTDLDTLLDAALALAKPALEQSDAEQGEDAWQPIETAPKDGTVFLAYWGDDPQFVAWVDGVPDEVEYRRAGPFWNRRTEKMVKSRETGFRVVLPPCRDLGWGVHGNFAPFTPTHWMSLPKPSASAIEARRAETSGSVEDESAAPQEDAHTPQVDKG